MSTTEKRKPGEPAGGDASMRKKRKQMEDKSEAPPRAIIYKVDVTFSRDVFKSSYGSFENVADMADVPKAKYYLYNDTTARKYGVKGLKREEFREPPSYELPDKPLDIDPTSNEGRIEHVVYFYSGKEKRRKPGEPLKKRPRYRAIPVAHVKQVRGRAAAPKKKKAGGPLQQSIENDEAVDSTDSDNPENPEPERSLSQLSPHELGREMMVAFGRNQQDDPMSLCKLPTVAIKLILCNLLVTNTTVELFNDWSFVANAGDLPLYGEILRTCKFFYTNGIPILYGCNIFHTIACKATPRGRKPLFYVDKHRPWIRRAILSVYSQVIKLTKSTDNVLASALQIFGGDPVRPPVPLNDNGKAKKRKEWTAHETAEQDQWKKVRDSRSGKRKRAMEKRSVRIFEATETRRAREHRLEQGIKATEVKPEADKLARYLHPPKQVYLSTLQIRIVPLQRALFQSVFNIKREHAWQKMFAKQSALWNALEWTPCMTLELEFVEPSANTNTTRRRRAMCRLEGHRYRLRMDRYYRHIDGWFGSHNAWIHDDAWMEHQRKVTGQTQRKFWDLPKTLAKWWETTNLGKKQKGIFDEWHKELRCVTGNDAEDIDDAISNRDEQWLTVKKVKELVESDDDNSNNDNNDEEDGDDDDDDDDEVENYDD